MTTFSQRINATLSFNGMTKGLDERTYAISKVHVWIDLLNKNMRPTKFYAPTSNGTRINVEQILNQEDYDKGLEELDGFMYTVNKKHGTDFKLSMKEEEKPHE